MALDNVQKIFQYNPFSGILEDDIGDVIVPKFKSTILISKLKSTNNLALEFIGKQGRGKTTHLKYLQQQLPQFPIYLLNSRSKFSDISTDTSPTIFVDSIHHLNIADRIRLFRQTNNIVYTTHWNRQLECLIAKKNKHTIRFKGIDVNTLRTILNNRLESASHQKLDHSITFTNKEADLLIQQFGDNYRGIINHLYESYQ